MCFGRLDSYPCRSNALPGANAIEDFLAGRRWHIMRVLAGIAFSAGNKRQNGYCHEQAPEFLIDHLSCFCP